MSTAEKLFAKSQTEPSNITKRENDIFIHIQRRNKFIALKNKTDFSSPENYQGIVIKRKNIFSRNENLSVCGTVRSSEQMQKG